MAEIAAGAHVAESALLEDGVTVAPGAVIGARARLRAGTSVGAGAVIGEDAQIGAECTIEPLALVGKRPRLRPGSSAAGSIGTVSLANGVTVCAGAIVYAGAEIAAGAIIGDHSQVRERASIGERSVVGHGSTVDFDATVGARVSIQTGVYVTAHSIVEDHVFLGPGVCTTNDNDMGRHERGGPLYGPVFRRACRVGSRAVLLPGIEIGEEAFVATGSVVTRSVGPRELVMGAPARLIRQVAEEELLERWG